MVLDQRRLAPAGNLLPVQQRYQAAAIDIRGSRRAAELREGRVQVDVLDDLLDRASGRNSGAGDDERNLYIRIVGGHFPGHEPEFAHVIAVVGAEHEKGIVRFANLGDRRLQLADHLVDGKDRLGAHAEIAIDARHFGGGKGRAGAQPLGRVRVGHGVEGRRARSKQSGKRVGVPRGGRVGRVRRKRRNLDQKRRSSRLLDEAYPNAREDIRHIVHRLIAVVNNLAVFIEVVVEAGITIAGHRPQIPPGFWGMQRRQIAVQVLAEHGGAVPDRLKRGRKRRPLVMTGVKRQEAAVIAGVAENAGIMRKAPGEDRRARGAAK